MGYHDNDLPQPMSEPEPPGVIEIVVSAVVRLIGIAVLLVGVLVGVKVVLEAWALYEDPARIESFAQAVDAGSNLDGLVAGISQSVGGEAATRGGSLRLSYFAAWFIVLLLIFVVGSLAMAAITTGGQLALYDLQFRRYSRHVLKEMRAIHRRG